MGSVAGLAGLGGPAGLAWPAMHQFCAAGLEGLGGLLRAGGYVGGWHPAGGPSRPVSGPWRAIAGWARLVAGCGPAVMIVFTVQPYSTVGLYSVQAYGLAYGLTSGIARAKPTHSLRVTAPGSSLLSIYRIMKPS